MTDRKRIEALEKLLCERGKWTDLHVTVDARCGKVRIVYKGLPRSGKDFRQALDRVISNHPFSPFIK